MYYAIIIKAGCWLSSNTINDKYILFEKFEKLKGTSDIHTLRG